ncbi:hypothetical protein ACRAWG_36300 [Methylobacterium sp. P31]
MLPSASYRRGIWCIAAGVLVIALAQAACAQVLGAHDMLRDARSFGFQYKHTVIATRSGPLIPTMQG